MGFTWPIDNDYMGVRDDKCMQLCRPVSWEQRFTSDVTVAFQISPSLNPPNFTLSYLYP